jgi:hypothetical protein
MYTDIKNSLQEKGVYNKIIYLLNTLNSMKNNDDKIELLLFELQKAKNAGKVEGMKEALNNIVTSVTHSFEASLKDSLEIEESIIYNQDSIV